MEVLEKLIKYNESGQAYYLIVNDKKKIWLFNSNNIKRALELYQPTSLKGIMFKKIFPYIKDNQITQSLLDVEKVKIKINEKIHSNLQNIFGENFHVSIFGGTPCSHQKVIFQISQDDEVIAYCKITDNKEVAELFDQECETLNYLKKCGVENIPKVINRSSINEFEIFIQNNVKDSISKTPTKLDQICIEFLLDLYNKTKVQLSFDKTDYFNMLNELKYNCKELAESERNSVLNSINEIETKYKKSKVSFCQYHGDFTPWNMVINHNKLVVFDFEYSKRTYPPFLDVYHFFMQTEIFINHSNIDLILKKADKILKLLNKNGIHNNLYFKMYLLEIINLYLSRGNDDGLEETQNMKLRLKILESLNKKK